MEKWNTGYKIKTIPRKAQRVFKSTTRKLFVSLCNIRSAVREHPRSIISQQNDLDIIWTYYDGGEDHRRRVLTYPPRVIR